MQVWNVPTKVCVTGPEELVNAMPGLLEGLANERHATMIALDTGFVTTSNLSDYTMVKILGMRRWVGMAWVLSTRVGTMPPLLGASVTPAFLEQIAPYTCAQRATIPLL